MNMNVVLIVFVIIVIALDILRYRKERKFRRAVVRKIMMHDMWEAITDLRLTSFMSDIERLHELIGSDGTDTEVRVNELIRQEIERLEKIHFPYRTQRS